MRLFEWLEERTGLSAALGAFGKPIRGGARVAHSFGTVLAVLFIVEGLTGMGLALYYASTGAWASVNYVQNQVALGWFLRGLHHQNGNAMIIVAIVHLVQSLFYGA